MCGRFALTSRQDEIESFLAGLTVDTLEPRYNIAPSQTVSTVLNTGPCRLAGTRWGLIPAWEKGDVPGRGFINARAETLGQKPSFKSLYRKKRCIILASGFFEWKAVQKGPKVPFFFKLSSGEPFGFAGLWSVWKKATGDEIVTSTIITTIPNELLSKVHNRMPVILKKEHIPLWLSPGEAEPEDLSALLVPYPAAEMTGYPVNPRVNSPAFDDPVCIVPAVPGPQALI